MSGPRLMELLPSKSEPWFPRLRARRGRLGATRPFLQADGSIVPQSLATIERLELGGVKQWVMMRGEDRENPVLVMLHGGPGLGETMFFRRFNAPLEKHFTVLYWDQRGAGKSYDRLMSKKSMTVEQFLADLDELVDVVCKRLGKKQVVLFGHSWGSALGVLYAARHPEKVAAYVGSGQVGDWAAGETASYAFALGEAERQGNQRVLQRLRTIGPPPHDARKLWVQRTCLQRLEGQLGGKSLWKLARMVLEQPEASVLELPKLLRGFRFSLDAMWAEVSRLNLLEEVKTLRMPVFLFLGRNDHWVPPEQSMAFFDALEAPAKKVVLFEHSGHEPFADEAGKFNAAMIDVVRPVVAPRAPARA